MENKSDPNIPPLIQVSIYDRLQLRSSRRRKTAFNLLYLSIAIVLTGIVMMFWQLGDLKGNLDTVNIVARLSFVLFIFFISGVFLRLYKYNMMMADFYVGCCDAITMSEEFDRDKIDSFEKLVKVLSPDKILLEVPDGPKVNELLKPDK